jgi:hypothetical protein
VYKWVAANADGFDAEKQNAWGDLPMKAAEIKDPDDDFRGTAPKVPADPQPPLRFSRAYSANYQNTPCIPASASSLHVFPHRHSLPHPLSVPRGAGPVQELRGDGQVRGRVQRLGLPR